MDDFIPDFKSLHKGQLIKVRIPKRQAGVVFFGLVLGFIPKQGTIQNNLLYKALEKVPEAQYATHANGKYDVLVRQGYSTLNITSEPAYTKLYTQLSMLSDLSRGTFEIREIDEEEYALEVLGQKWN